MKTRFETCDVKLTPLSPIHISSGNPDYGWGAVWLPSQEKMFILDSERFSQKLVESALLDKYIESVEKWIYLSDTEKEKQPNPCFTFLRDNRQFLFPDINIEKFVKELSITELNAPNKTRFIRNGEGHAYIPGSSIKGAIRTAVVYAMLEEHKRQTKIDYLNDTYLNSMLDGKSTIPSDTKSGFDTRKGMDKKLLESILEDFELIEKDNCGSPVMLHRGKIDNGSITNLMRAILVSDSTPIPHIQKNLVDEDIKIIMLDNPNSCGERGLNKNALPYAIKENRKQCYEPNQQPIITFKITIDHEILRSFSENTTLQKFPIIIQNLYDIKKIIDKFFTAVWKAEEEYYLDFLTIYSNNIREEKMIEKVLDFYDNETNTYPKLLPNINIGLGSGMLCKTLLIAVKEEYQIKIRNLQMTQRQIENQNRTINGRGNPVDWTKKIAPNSRHLVFRNSDKFSNAFSPLGWANLEFGSITYEDNAL